MNASQSLPRFSIRTLMLLIALACVGPATIVSASDLASWAMRVLAALLIPIATLLGMFSAGKSRAFWTGYAVLSVWSYVFLFTDVGSGYVLWNPLRKTYDDHIASAIADLHSQWIEVRSLALAREQWQWVRAQPAGDELANARITAELPKMIRGVRSSIAGTAFEIAQFQIQIWISIFGGFLAVWLWSRRDRGPPDSR